MYYQNVNRMRSKTHQLYLNILNSDYDVICLTETNLDVGIFNEEMFDERYNVFRRDRNESSYNGRKDEGGGVIVAIKKCYTVIRRSSWDSNFEDVWISILPKSSNHSPLNICLCYLPPYLLSDDVSKFMTHCQNIILNNNSSGHFILVGDFNFPEIYWNKSDLDSRLTPGSAVSSKDRFLFDTMALCDLKQYNSFRNCNDRLLDLVLSTINDLEVNEIDPLLNLDRHHPALLINLDYCNGKPNLMKPNPNVLKPNFYKCNFDNVRDYLGKINWYDLFDGLDIDSAVEALYEEINSAILLYTPLKKCNPHLYPYWFSYPLIQCLREKEKYHKLFKKFANPRDYDTYKMLRSRSKHLMDACYKSMQREVENNLDKDVRQFFKFVNNKKSGATRGVPESMSHGDKFATDPQGICELFSTYFSSVYEISDNNDSTFALPDRLNLTLNNVFITREDIVKKIQSLDSHKGPGPDGIPSLFVKECCDELSEPLFIVFNKSLNSGIFPNVWKNAYVVPIHKSGDRTKCENYRPISILSCIAKIFESLVYEHVYSHVKQAISNFQHGFVSGRSTVSNLLVYKNYICQAFASNKQVDSIYTDFSKAFDKVDHRILSAKLAAYGIHGNLLRWLISYLSNRSQIVAVKGFLSKPVELTSGVPQGSHLGPLLFIIFINDLVEHISSEVLLYADDLKLFRVVNGVNDCLMLQRDLDNIQNWCFRNKMYLNVDKCFYITFTTKKSQIQYEYHIGNQLLAQKSVAKDLGVYFDSKLNFKEHFEYISNRGYQLVGFIIRIMKDFKKPSTLIYLFNVLVRSVLEYASVVWSPFYNVHSAKIEGVQRRFLRSICFKYGLIRTLATYDDRAKYFNVTRLDRRRQLCELVYLHKIVHSSIDCPELVNLINFNGRSRLRDPRIFRLIAYKNNTSFFNPIVRMCRDFDELRRRNADLDIFNPNLSHYKRIVKSILDEHC